MNKKGALAEARTLLAEYKHLKGKELEDYITYNFDDQWNYYDVTKSGLIEIERMSQFYRTFLKDMTLDL